MTIGEAKSLIFNQSRDLQRLLDCLIKLSEDKGYLLGRKGLEDTISELNSLIQQLQKQVLALHTKDEINNY